MIRRLDFRITEREDGVKGHRVRLTAEGELPAEAHYDFGGLDRGGTFADALSRIDTNYCRIEDLKEVGEQLWGGLCNGEVQVLYARVRDAGLRDKAIFHVRLGLPQALQRLPWEALHEIGLGFLTTQNQFCVIRNAPEEIRRPFVPEPAPGPLRMLMVVPEGSDLQVGRERDTLVNFVEGLGGAIRIEVLSGRVTVDRLGKKLDGARWDLVHLAGHGRTSKEGRVSVRLNNDSGDECWMDDGQFAALFNDTHARLVFLNCCRVGATTSDRRDLGGLGPLLMTKGIPAVVAMRYEITDSVALSFSREFYRLLLTGGDERGRVDLAVDRARGAEFLSYDEGTVRGFITPALFLASGHEQLFDPSGLAGAAARAVQPPPMPTIASGASAVPLPDRLIRAFRESKCIPIVGPGLLGAGAVRDGPSPPGPRRLAELLAARSEYPQRADFALSESAGEWMDANLLQWVCQHFQSLEEIQDEIFSVIAELYGQQKPTRALRSIAAWSVPGIFCTFFDGLMEEAIRLEVTRGGGRNFHLVTSLQGDLDVEAKTPLLVALRGTWRKSESLRLTEEDHDQLWDQIGGMSARITDLLRASPGRSLFFLGIHPRDPLARRLCAKLMPREVSMRVGPVFFVHPDPSPVDEAYWSHFKVKWIRSEPGAVIEAVDAAIARGGEG